MSLSNLCDVVVQCGRICPGDIDVIFDGGIDEEIIFCHTLQSIITLNFTTMF